MLPPIILPNVPRSLQLAPEGPHLALRVVALDDLVEHDLQTLRIDGLRQVVVGAALDGG